MQSCFFDRRGGWRIGRFILAKQPFAFRYSEDMDLIVRRKLSSVNFAVPFYLVPNRKLPLGRASRASGYRLSYLNTARDAQKVFKIVQALNLPCANVELFIFCDIISKNTAATNGCGIAYTRV